MVGRSAAGFSNGCHLMEASAGKKKLEIPIVFGDTCNNLSGGLQNAFGFLLRF